MKKFALILCLSAVVVLNACVNTKEFVNPIFYEPLDPISNRSGWTYLTPTSIKVMTPLDKNEVEMTGQCKLLENRKDFIKMLCNTSWQGFDNVIHTSEDIYTYKIKGMFLNICPKVEQITYEITERGNEKSATSYYCISPSDSPSEAY